MPHAHSFSMTTHLDGCHWYTTIGTCRCGASVNVTNERDFKANPYSAVWAEPQLEEVRRDEKGRFITPRWEERRCQRCDELQAGAKIKSSTVIIAKDGTVEREEEVEYEQGEYDDDEGKEQDE